MKKQFFITLMLVAFNSTIAHALEKTITLVNKTIQQVTFVIIEDDHVIHRINIKKRQSSKLGTSADFSCEDDLISISVEAHGLASGKAATLGGNIYEAVEHNEILYVSNSK